MPKIVLVSGSIRRDSLNTAVLNTVRGMLTAGPEGDAYEIRTLSVGLLPFYDEEVERADSSVAVREAQHLVRDADALIISTPSYNGEMPGALKNALDWLSRPGGASALTGKTVAIASASPGPRGAVDAQAALAGVLVRCGARLVDHAPVAVGMAAALRTDAADYADPAVVAALHSLVDATLFALRVPADARA